MSSSRCLLCARKLFHKPRLLSTTARRAAPEVSNLPAHIRAQQEEERAKQEAMRYKRPDWNGTLAAGTPLGFKIFKDETEPVAKEDKEYPDWLWRLLDRPTFDGDPQRPGQINRRDPIKEIRRQLDKDRASHRHLLTQSRTV